MRDGATAHEAVGCPAQEHAPHSVGDDAGRHHFIVHSPESRYIDIEELKKELTALFLILYIDKETAGLSLG